jgi:hypothetical protein
MKSNLIGKRVRGINAHGQAVGEIGTVIAVFPNSADRYGNYPITVEYENGDKENTKIFWVIVVG